MISSIARQQRCVIFPFGCHSFCIYVFFIRLYVCVSDGRFHQILINHSSRLDNDDDVPARIMLCAMIYEMSALILLLSKSPYEYIYIHSFIYLLLFVQPKTSLIISFINTKYIVYVYYYYYHHNIYYETWIKISICEIDDYVFWYFGSIVVILLLSIIFVRSNHSIRSKNNKTTLLYEYTRTWCE